MSIPAVFLDRDGVLIADAGPVAAASEICVLDGVPNALSALAAGGFALVVVTNQTVIARGVATEVEVQAVHAALRQRLPDLDAIYVCPHHPNATLERYRSDCDCRKPRPGLLLAAARDLNIDLAASTLVGDRPSDITAGGLAGCTTVLVESGAQLEPPIETTLRLDRLMTADYVCANLTEAAQWILAQR